MYYKPNTTNSVFLASLASAEELLAGVTVTAVFFLNTLKMLEIEINYVGFCLLHTSE